MVDTKFSTLHVVDSTKPRLFFLLFFFDFRALDFFPSQKWKVYSARAAGLEILHGYEHDFSIMILSIKSVHGRNSTKFSTDTTHRVTGRIRNIQVTKISTHLIINFLIGSTLERFVGTKWGPELQRVSIPQVL